MTTARVTSTLQPRLGPRIHHLAIELAEPTTCRALVCTLQRECYLTDFYRHGIRTQTQGPLLSGEIHTTLMRRSVPLTAHGSFSASESSPMISRITVTRSVGSKLRSGKRTTLARRASFEVAHFGVFRWVHPQNTAFRGNLKRQRGILADCRNAFPRLRFGLPCVQKRNFKACASG